MPEMKVLAFDVADKTNFDNIVSDPGDGLIGVFDPDGGMADDPFDFDANHKKGGF